MSAMPSVHSPEDECGPANSPSQVNTTENQVTIDQKGVLIDIGSTSLVELLPSGDIIKTAWPGRDRDVERREELALESRIYDLLGEHACLVKKKAWDARESTLVLEYMPNGTLKNHLRAHPEVSVETRRRWIEQAAQGVHLLHTLSIIHCDIGPHNFLLDANLNLKISDFSGSSLDASGTNTRPGTRYTGADSYWTAKRPPTPDNDIFGLGSTIYFIMTGTAPFEEIPSHEVDRRYQAREFPELAGIQCADVIAKCWHREIRSAQEVVDMIKTPGRDPSSGTCDSGVISNGVFANLGHLKASISCPRAVLLATVGFTTATLVYLAAINRRPLGLNKSPGLTWLPFELWWRGRR